MANDRALGNYCVRKESPHRLIEGFMTDPEASVSVLVCHYPGEDNDAQLFAQTRTLRIRQMDGLELSTDKRDLAAPGRCHLTLK